MRLPLTAVALLLASAPALAETHAGSWLSVYSSNDGLSVVSPQVSVRSTVPGNLELQGGYEADIITAASVDVLTAASPRGYHEVRQGVTLGTTWRPAVGTSVAARYLPSWEPDYESHTLVAAASREWLDHRLTTELGLRFEVDSVGRRGAARETWRPLDSGGVDLGVGWVFGPRTLGQVVYEVQLLDGFQSSPYRFARLYWPGLSLPIGVPEEVPDFRVRHAVGASLRHAVTRRWYANVSYRLYRDTWGIWSHTEEAELQYATVGDRFIVGLSGRLYGQSAADFYQHRYVAPEGELPRYRTADKLLVRSWTALAGLRASYAFKALGPLAELRFTSKVELYEQRFFDFAPLASRTSFIVSFGITGEL